MPTLEFVRESKIVPTFRVEQVRGMFDVPEKESVRHEWRVQIPIEEKEWRIGLIVGPSGSGKSTLAKELFPKAYHHEAFNWPEKESLLDGFPENLEGKAITKALSQVGFASPPHWLKPFGCLSNGQKMRAELARCLLLDADCVVFDEFTSVVDRDVAKVCSHAVQKEIRRRQRPLFVAVSCHYDIIDWLEPDWVFDMADMGFKWRRLRGRPAISLKIHQADRRAWKMFAGNHYLSASLHKAAQCFVATWEGNPVAFTSYIHFPHARVRNAKREHRTVVLPDYQGIGLGNFLSEWLGAKLRSEGMRFYSLTSHPAMIFHRAKSPKWRCSRSNRNPSSGYESQRGNSWQKSGACLRQSASFEFIGAPEDSHQSPKPQPGPGRNADA